MSYTASILADSISPAGHRLTSFEITFPRFILSEFNTHRVFSRNSASSRAIPVKKQLERVLTEPFIPEKFGVNQPGMEANRFLERANHDEAVEIWLNGRNRAALTVLELLLGRQLAQGIFGDNPSAAVLLGRLPTIVPWLEKALKAENPADTAALNVHKQSANRVLEPYMWHTVIVTATEWGNFWGLRAHPSAQPEIQEIASLMKALYEEHEPHNLDYGGWHLPLVGFDGDEELTESTKIKVCAGRCARISYLTHDKKRDPEADIALHDRLVSSGHMSPCEHPARAMTPAELEVSEWSGNFQGWFQYRKELDDESDYSKILATRSQD